MNTIIEAITHFIDKEVETLEEVNAIGAGNISGGPIVKTSSRENHDILTSGDLEENVLDRMGYQKATNNIRRNSISSEVYLDKDDPKSKRTKKVISRVAKNLNKIPYSSDPPTMGMKKVFVYENLIEQIVLEAKIDVAIEEESNKEVKDLLELFKNKNIPSKFVSWVHRMLKKSVLANEIPSLDLIDKVVDSFPIFNTLAAKNALEKKDINTYQSFEEFIDYIEERSKVISKTVQKKQNLTNSQDILYQDETYLVTIPHTEEASCILGKGTKWCISASYSDNQFEHYKEKGTKHIFIINKNNNDKDAISVLENGKVIVHDAADIEKTTPYIKEKYPDEVLFAIDQYMKSRFGVIVFDGFDSKVVLSDIKSLLSNDSHMFKIRKIAYPYEEVLNKSISLLLNGEVKLTQQISYLIEHAAYNIVKEDEKKYSSVLNILKQDPNGRLFGVCKMLEYDLKMYYLQEKYNLGLFGPRVKFLVVASMPEMCLRNSKTYNEPFDFAMSCHALSNQILNLTTNKSYMVGSLNKEYVPLVRESFTFWNATVSEIKNKNEVVSDMITLFNVRMPRMVQVVQSL